VCALSKNKTTIFVFGKKLYMDTLTVWTVYSCAEDCTASLLPSCSADVCAAMLGEGLEFDCSLRYRAVILLLLVSR
jgi:hypothetical protein